jgi:predicted dehydrogenase
MADIVHDPEINAVIIESWTHNMRELTEAAIDAGKAVLLEKPASNNTENMAAIVEAHRKSNTLVQIGYMMRQSPVVERIRKILTDGTLGRTTVCKFHVSVPAPDAVTPWFNLEHDIGGVLFEDGCHMMDIVLSLLGKPKRISATIRKYDDLSRKHNHLYEDAAVLTMEWDDMVGSFICVGWEANDWIETWQLDFYGDTGTLSVGLLPQYFRIYLKEQRGEYGRGWTTLEPSQFPVSWLDHDAKHVWHAVHNREFFKRELQQFVSGIRSGVHEVGATPKDALDVISITAAAYEAERTQRTVDIA